MPEEATPEEAMPEEATPEEAMPEEAMPEEATPEEATPEEAVPEEAVPDNLAQLIPEEQDIYALSQLLSPYYHKPSSFIENQLSAALY